MGKDPNPDLDANPNKLVQAYDCLTQLAPPLALAKMAAIAATDSLRRNIPETVARLTGGEYFKLTNAKGLERNLEAISNHVPNRYVLSFQPQSPHPGLHVIGLQLRNDILFVGRKGHAEGREPAHSRKRSCCAARHRREGRRTCATCSLTCPPGIERHGRLFVRIFSRKGQEKDERAKQIEQEMIEKLERNLADEIRILTDERLKRLENILGAKEVLADLHDERTNKKLLSKADILTRDIIELISTAQLSSVSATPTRTRA